MKFSKIVWCLLFISTASINSYAQLGRDGKPFSWWSGVDNPEEDGSSSVKHKNNIKINLTPIALGYYSFFYERAISEKMTIQVGARFAPNLSSSFNDQVTTLTENFNTEAGYSLDSFVNLGKLKMSNYNFSFEPRFYLGKKGVFKSAYIGIYANAGNSTLSFPLSYNDGGTRKFFTLDGKFNTFGGGITSGFQFSIADRITIDIILIAGGISVTDGTLTAAFNPALNQTSRDDIKKTANDILGSGDLSGFFDAKLTVDPTGNKVTLKTNATLPTIKSGFCIGFRF
jgi:hypothetical protein